MLYVYDPAIDHAFATYILAGAAFSLIAFCAAFVCLLRAWRRAKEEDPSIYVLKERLHRQGIARARQHAVACPRQTRSEPTSVGDLETLQARLLATIEARIPSVAD